jgi:hypothetical protein
MGSGGSVGSGSTTGTGSSLGSGGSVGSGTMMGTGSSVSVGGSVGSAGETGSGSVVGAGGALGSGGSAGSGGTTVGAGGDGSNAGGAGGASPGSRAMEELISAEWTVPPGTESYTCARKTITEDIYVDGFEATIPLGTHHTLLTMGPPDKPDGVIPCSVAELRTVSVFSSGVGTDPLTFPSGVALKIAKGTQLLLNLHLFNTSPDHSISGKSGTLIHRVAEADAKIIAEEQLAGTILINLPPHTKKTTIGGCLASSDVTVFAVAPHMHKLGVHLKVIGQSSITGDRVIHDAPYSFDEQSFAIIEPLKLKKGDNIRVECTHDNTTDSTVTFGESSLAEMCFAGLYRYPADGSYFICTSGPTM